MTQTRAAGICWAALSFFPIPVEAVMFTRHLLLLGAVLVALSLAGCNSSKATGKFSNQDKPKPVDAAGK
jgi:hypothetical protein